jgi:hypothetical protein
MAALIEATQRPTTDLISSTSTKVAVKALMDGTLSIMDFANVMSLEGRVFSASAGSVTTPVTFGAGTIDTTEPDLQIIVPSGTTIIPLDILLVMEAYGSTALFEFMASIGQGSTVAHGTDTDVTPVNVNLGYGTNTACTVGAASNADAVYQTSNIVEFWRGCEPVAVTVATADDDSTFYPVNYSWKAKDAGYLPILNGKGALTVFAASQAGTGFIQCRWAEFPTAYLS